MITLVRVPFHGDEIECVQREDGVWISLRRACESVGVDFASQTTKLRAKPWATVAMITTVAEDGKNREFFCLHLDSVPMWLATIEPSRVKPEARDSLVAYQREAARVLRDHFLGRSQAGPMATVASQPPALVDAQLAAVNRQLVEMRKTLQALVATRRAEPAPAAPAPFALPAAGQAGAALVGSEEMARLLGMSLRSFASAYRANAQVWASRIEVGGQYRRNM